MAKPRLVENRAGWAGGLNTASNPDQLNANELVVATNARVSAPHGAISKRTGSRRLSEDAPGTGGSAAAGVTVWDAPAGKQMVAVTGSGHLAFKNLSAGEYGAFTNVLLTPAIGGAVSFQPFRNLTTGAPLVLYIAGANGQLYSWDGTAAALLTGTNGAPAATMVKAYHTRLFAVDTNFRKSLFWSDIGDGTTWDGAPPAGGGQNIIDTLSGEEILALEVVGSSLAVATEESVVRFTGYSGEDVIIQQDAEGISAQHGPLWRLLFRRFEDFVAMLTDRGPYAVGESGVVPIGVKVENLFKALNFTDKFNMSIAYHRGRSELWLAVRRTVDSPGPKSIYVYDVRLQAWSGPFVYPFVINDLARYEDLNGDEFIMAACADGFIRHMDTGVLDDVLFDASAGSSYGMEVEFAPEFGAPGPGVQKLWHRMKVQANLPAASALRLRHTSDDGALVTEPQLSGDATPAIRDYTIDFRAQANRLRLGFEDFGDGTSTIHGYQLYGHNMLRER